MIALGGSAARREIGSAVEAAIEPSTRNTSRRHQLFVMLSPAWRLWYHPLQFRTRFEIGLIDWTGLTRTAVPSFAALRSAGATWRSRVPSDRQAPDAGRIQQS